MRIALVFFGAIVEPAADIKPTRESPSNPESLMSTLSKRVGRITFRIAIDHDSHIDVGVNPDISCRRIVEEVEETTQPHDDLAGVQTHERCSFLALVEIEVAGPSLPEPVEIEADEWINEEGRFWSIDDGGPPSHFDSMHRRTWNSTLPIGLTADDLWFCVQKAIVDAGIELQPSKRCTSGPRNVEGNGEVLNLGTMATRTSMRSVWKSVSEVRRLAAMGTADE